jgi:hypothetical protein
MTRPIVRIHDLSTDEVIDREMNDTEFEHYQTVQTEFENAQAEAEARATAKAELLERLGITAEEAQLLLGGN